MSTLDQLCIGCFAKLRTPGAYCTICGYNQQKDAEVQHRLAPRTILSGKYMVGKPLGEGGFGITYLGYDLNLDIKVAIKEFYPFGFVTRSATQSTTVQPLAGEQGEFFLKGRERFVDEAKRLAKFRTFPGIVIVNDFFVENGTAYIVMEYVEGETLKNYMAQQGGRLPVDMILSMMMPVFQSLSQIHDEGLIHRDISPDNIMITHDGSMKLLDFGAAREFGEDGNKSMSVMLKHGYAPPEQYTSRGVQGPHTDVYALCATIYKAVTGVTPEGSMDRAMEDHLQPPSALGAALPYHVEHALMRGLAVKSADRFQTIGELYAALYNAECRMQNAELGYNQGIQQPVGGSVYDAPQPSVMSYTLQQMEQPPALRATPFQGRGQETSYAQTPHSTLHTPHSSKPMKKGQRNGIIAAAVGACVVIALVVALTAGDNKDGDATTDDPNGVNVAATLDSNIPTPETVIETVRIPSGLAGKTQEDVEELLDDLELELNWLEEHDESVAEGRVVYVQDEGQSVQVGSTVDIVVSLGSIDPINRFVTRLYNKVMEHEPDGETHSYWSDQLRYGYSTGIEFAYELFFSNEFLSRNLSDEDFVEVLYKALLGRDPDTAGKANWVEQLNNGMSRERVFDGFVNSQEFENLCIEHGINRGTSIQSVPVRLKMDILALLGQPNSALRALYGDECRSYLYDGGIIVSADHGPAFFLGASWDEAMQDWDRADPENRAYELEGNIWSDDYMVNEVLEININGNLSDLFDADYPITLDAMTKSFQAITSPSYYPVGEHYEWSEYNVCYVGFQSDKHYIRATFREIGSEYVLIEAYVYSR